MTIMSAGWLSLSGGEIQLTLFNPIIFVLMKNIALIKSIVAASISSANTAELTEHIVALIQAHPEEIRENVLALLTGTAELTVRPVDQVELTCDNSNYSNLSFKGEPTVNLLEGTVRCSISYTRTETRWYKTEEDAVAGRNGSYNHDDYVIARERAYEDSTSVTFDIREWNTGKVVWRR